MMNEQPLTTDPLDICLILRAHAEQLWLTSQVLPTVRQLEQPGTVGDEQMGAALAYLEVAWLDACVRAADTDAAHEALCRAGANSDRVLFEQASRYHASVRWLRTATGQRVWALTSPRDAFEPFVRRPPIVDGYAGM